MDFQISDDENQDFFFLAYISFVNLIMEEN